MIKYPLVNHITYNHCTRFLSSNHINQPFKMSQILPVVIYILAVTTVNLSNVNSWPMTAPIRQLTETNNLPKSLQTDGHEFVTSPSPAILASHNILDTNPIASIQVPVRETLPLSRPSSQTFDREPSLQPKDSSLVPDLLTSTTRVDSKVPSTSRNIPYKQNFSTYHEKDNFDADMLSEGSGSGPLQSSSTNHRAKSDDTEDSSDDDGDDDEDYDYRGILDSGSGNGHPRTTTERPKQVSAHGNIVEKSPQNDFYYPFRPPTISTDSTDYKQITNTLTQPEMTTRHIVTTRSPLRVSSASPSIIITSTTYAPENSSTTPRNLVLHANKDNSTRADVDYDYEDDDDDEDSEETSVFEDNDSSETVPVNKSPPRHQSNLTINAQSNNSSVQSKPSRVDITKPTVYATTNNNQYTRRPPNIAELPKNTTQYYTTPRPITQQTSIRPAITSPTTSSHSTKLGSNSGDGDEDLDDDEEGEDDEEEEEDEMEDDDMDSDDRAEDSNVSPSTAGSVNRNNHSIPVLKPYAVDSSTRPAATLSPDHHGFEMHTLSPIITPSQEKYRPFDYRPTTAPSSLAPTTTIAPHQNLSVPKITSTTSTVSATPTTVQPDSTFLSDRFHPNNQSDDNSAHVLAGPTRLPATSILPHRVEHTIIPPPITSSGRPPQVTTNIQNFDRALHDNGDTLTKQIYDKAVGVYQEADKTIRAAWQAVWPPNLNFDSTAVEPLLNQPLFFMLALGGTVIGLVLLMMLVVYIITYQIQPKDDDNSIY